MERYLSKRGLTFTPILNAQPHVYVRKGHPFANQKAITMEGLKDYPYVSYEQGKHNVPLFTEEIINPYSNKQVEISDRASLMNVLLQTDCYTVGTGIMPSLLNEGRIVSIPFEIDDFYTIGYILRSDRNLSDITKTFIKMLSQLTTEGK